MFAVLQFAWRVRITLSVSPWFDLEIRTDSCGLVDQKRGFKDVFHGC